VAPSSWRAVASFEPGSMTRATTSASARLAIRDAPSPEASSRSSPMRRAVPNTAATCPCGSERSIFKPRPSVAGTASASTRRNASIFAAGQCERLASVRVLTLLPSRQPSRSR
jgi:hypothetical protein